MTSQHRGFTPDDLCFIAWSLGRSISLEKDGEQKVLLEKKNQEILDKIKRYYP